MKKSSILVVIIVFILIALFYLFQDENNIKEEPEEIIYSQEIQDNLEKLKQIQEQAKIDALKLKIPKTFENVEPYTQPLPPVPDQKLNDSTLFGIDANNNGVRDDLEHWIVKRFGKDKMVVESFFAFVRSKNLNIKIQKEGIFTDELYKNDISKRASLANGCRYKYFHLSQFLTYDTELYIISRKFEKLINNTIMRKKNAKHFFSNLSGRVGKIRLEITEQECKEFFKETKLYNY